MWGRGLAHGNGAPSGSVRSGDKALVFFLIDLVDDFLWVSEKVARGFLSGDI